jgi:YHS domain-containing protein
MTKQIVIVVALVSVFCAFTIAQDQNGTEMKEKQDCMKESSSCCSKQSMHNDMKMESSTETATVQIWNKVCPVKGEEVDVEAPTVEYNGKVIGFCCPGCDSKFQKDPEKYMKNLNEDGTKFLGS